MSPRTGARRAPGLMAEATSTALACVLYEMLAGEATLQPVPTAHAIIAKRPEPNPYRTLGTVRPAFSPCGGKAAVTKALAKAAGRPIRHGRSLRRSAHSGLGLGRTHPPMWRFRRRCNWRPAIIISGRHGVGVIFPRIPASLRAHPKRPCPFTSSLGRKLGPALLA